MYIKKISGYHLMWPVSIAHVRGYLHNSHMTKTTCDVCLAGLPLYLTNLYHMIIMQISWSICVFYIKSISCIWRLFYLHDTYCSFYVSTKQYIRNSPYKLTKNRLSMRAETRLLTYKSDLLQLIIHFTKQLIGQGTLG